MEKALSPFKDFRVKKLTEDVRSHLDRRFAELGIERQTTENFQAIIADMGPPSDYAELLKPEAVSAARNVSRKHLLYVGLAVVVIITSVVLLSMMASSKGKMITTEQGGIVDKIDYPFVNDPEALGTWQSVDFVENLEDFKLGVKRFKGDLYLKELFILENGRTNFAFTFG